ncbi:patatin-like phospholipase family protein [Acanthopleuribacter pedis]|uniref:Patatin-like phospholipase family protein n=1 Tax=Acanthopleuribacter pedis TaxID=442870 RepID=A0A8J7U381_9BACT|nr:patatin-like phospholipase family protein [Acanthopleuribacter pedis]MBO1319352.1 patatin-like phospholipase family protein [Acanthopleuribacter pedis]
MSATKLPPFPVNQNIRLMCFDGGGILGYFTAIMLRQLCEKDSGFLGKQTVSAFAGTSIGSLISFLLAKEETPRDLIMSGELENIFHNSLLYSNRLNPIDGWLSFWGITAWSGQADMNAFLDAHFGDMKLGELNNRVLITTFSYGNSSGENQWFERIFRNFPSETHDYVGDSDWLVKDVAFGAVSPATLRPVQNWLSDGGMTAMSPDLSSLAQVIDSPLGNSAKVTMAVAKCLTRLEELLKLFANPPKDFSIANLMKGVNSSPPKLNNQHLEELHQANLVEKTDLVQIQELVAVMEQNVGKSGSDATRVQREFENELALIRALAKHRDFPAEKLTQLETAMTGLEQGLTRLVDLLKRLKTVSLDDLEATIQNLIPDLFHHATHSLKGNINDMARQVTELAGIQRLNRIEMFSLGVGQQTPGYFTENFNFGWLPFMTLPTNITQKCYAPPTFNLLYSPTTNDISYMASLFLPDDRYFRLNPQVVGFPVPSVIPATYMARFDFLKEYYLKSIRDQFNSGVKPEEIQAAVQWLTAHNWCEPLPHP